MSQRIILSCYGGERYELDYAVITLTDDLVAKIQRRMAAARSIGSDDNTASLVTYNDYSAAYHGYHRLSELWDGDDSQWAEVRDSVERHAWAILPADFPDLGDGERTTANYMDVWCDYSGRVHWEASPKHVNLTIETESLSLDEIVAAAEGRYLENEVAQ